MAGFIAAKRLYMLINIGCTDDIKLVGSGAIKLSGDTSLLLFYYKTDHKTEETYITTPNKELSIPKTH